MKPRVECHLLPISNFDLVETQKHEKYIIVCIVNQYKQSNSNQQNSQQKSIASNINNKHERILTN